MMQKDLASVPTSRHDSNDPPHASDNAELYESVVRWLESPATWGDGKDAVEKIETHISQVFLVGAYVYKLKKPVKFDFLDFSSLPAREHACREEVRLNRRLAPLVYLGIKAITVNSEGGFALDGHGRVVDWLVEMRRLPSERMLDARHNQKLLRPDDIDQLAQLLTDFYRSLTPVPVTPAAYRDHVLSHVHGNCDELLAASHHLSHVAVLRTQSFQLPLTTQFDQVVQKLRLAFGNTPFNVEQG